jgi:cytidylate kinase
MIQNGIDINNEASVLGGLKDVHIEIIYKDHTQYLYLNKIDVTELIRDQIIGEGASKVSAYLPVREKLVAMQQEMAKANSLVMDGRDIGTHVLTEATVKIYLTADVMVRARRRYNELVQKNVEANLEVIAEEIANRDYRDMNRDHAPLVQATDAVLIDTSSMSIDEVVQSIIQIAETR